jgi:hypothetical protein
MHLNDPGALRFKTRRITPRRPPGVRQGFPGVPWEEPNVYFGGHYNVLFPKPVYFSRVRKEGQPFTENDPVYGKVYHLGSSEDLLKLLETEHGFWYTSHPRTKSSGGQPDVYWDKPFAKSDTFLGLDFTQAMGTDLSEKRMTEYRSFDSSDTMNNLNANTGLMPRFCCRTSTRTRRDRKTICIPVPDRVPEARSGSGSGRGLESGLAHHARRKLLRHNGGDSDPKFAVEGSGSKRTLTADVSWTFPLEFVEVVWGDGKKIDRQIIPATDLPAFGTKHFSIPFDATGKLWVRLAVWDSAGNPGLSMPSG